MSNQGHIVIVITKSNMGGAQKYVLTLARRFHLQNKKVTVIAGGDGILFSELQKAGIPFIKLKNSERDISLSKEFKLCFELYKHIKKLRPTVLHLNSSKISVIGSIIGRLAQVEKVIFTAHGWAFNEARPKYQKLIFFLLYFFIISLTHKTICVSKKTKEQVSKLPFVQNKMTVIYNGIEEPLFLETHKAKEELSKRFMNLDGRKKWIGVIAELHHVKGHDILIKAISKIIEDLKDEYQIVLIGSGEREEDINKLIHQNNLKKQVFLTGFVENASQFLKAFNMIILPSRSEALPLTILEAGLAQTLVLASNVGGIPEIITPNRSGFLFEKENVNDLMKEIRKVLALTNEQKIEIIQLMENEIRNKFSVDKMINQTEEVYNS